MLHLLVLFWLLHRRFNKIILRYCAVAVEVITSYQQAVLGTLRSSVAFVRCARMDMVFSTASSRIGERFL